MTKEDRERAALLRRIANDEKAEIANRVERLLRGIKAHAQAFNKYELALLENALEPAVGRIVLERMEGK